MSCEICHKKGGLLAKKIGKCWACQKSACSKCARPYDGAALGWVKSHPVCPRCAEALDRQKSKVAQQSSLAGVTKKESDKAALDKAVSAIPEWTLPAPEPSSTSSSSTVPAAEDKNRLRAVGATRDEARRASRVLLRAVIENYADRDSTRTPVKGGQSEEESEEDEESSKSSDLDTPIVVVEESKEGKKTTESSARSSPAVSTPVSKLRAAEDEGHKRRLSRGIIAGLEEINSAATAMNRSYTAPRQDDTLVDRLTTEEKPAVASGGGLDDDFERELRNLDAFASATDSSSSLLKPGSFNLSSIELGRVETPEAKKMEARLEAQLVADDAEEWNVEVGEEIHHNNNNDDAELMAQIDSLDTVISPAMRAQVEADPVAHIGDVLSQVASNPSNTEASVAMHEDLIEVLAEVRREERDAKMVAMLDGVEAKLKDSLVRVSTPKMRRKVEHAKNLFHIGQIVSARNAMDGCWYTAKIQDTDAEEGRYLVQFMTGGNRTQMCSENADLRKYLVGNQVLALYRDDGLGLLQPAIVEYVTPEGLYKVRFLSDSKVQLCGDLDLRPSSSAAAAPSSSAAAAAPVVASAAVVTTPVRKGANPNQVSKKDLIVRGVSFVESWIAEQKSSALRAALDTPSERRTLLAQAQLLAHIRKMFEVPVSQQEPFELRMQDTQKGDTALYTKLQSSVIAAADYLLAKFRSLHQLVAHPKAEGERLDGVGAKVDRIKDFIRGSSTYLSQI